MLTQHSDATRQDKKQPAVENLEGLLQSMANAAYPADDQLRAARPNGDDETVIAVLDRAEETSSLNDITEHWSEATFRGVLESLPDALVIVGSDGRMGLVNSQTERLFGYERNELLNQPVELLVPEGIRKRHVQLRNRYFDDPRVRPMGAGLDLFGRKKDGTEFPVEISLSPMKTESGLYVISTIRNTTEKKRLEARYRTLVEEIPAVTFMAALDGGIGELYVSPQIEELLGFSQKEWLENPVLWYTQLHEEDRERWHTEFARTVNSAERFQSVYRFRARDGRVVWVHGEAKVGRDTDGRPLFLQGVAFDITDRKEAEEALRHARDELEVKVQRRTSQIQQSLQEKELLLKEIHHRVKNNLQLISSLLRLQSGNINDPQTLEVFKESQDRVKTMARIHEELYQSKDLARIDFGQYTRGLVTSLIRSFGRGINLIVDIHDVYFGIDTAIPCGLIINELVSNCLKYAFPDGRAGEISIRLAADGPQHFNLTVSDDGVGMPADFDFRKSKSLGLQLVNTLVNQLKGKLQLGAGAGTEFTICFGATLDERK